MTEHRWAVPHLDVDGNGQTLWEAWFFKRDISTTSQRGPWPLAPVWITEDSLMKDMRWASRDYALRKISDDWFFGASSTFGQPVERSLMVGVNGWGGWPLLSDLVSKEALTPNHRWGNADTELQTDTEDWFFGKTAGSEDMSILYTYGAYPEDKSLRIEVLQGRLLELVPRRNIYSDFDSTALIRDHRFGNSDDTLGTVLTRWFFGYTSYPDLTMSITYE